MRQPLNIYHMFPRFFYDLFCETFIAKAVFFVYFFFFPTEKETLLSRFDILETSDFSAYCGFCHPSKVPGG